MSNVHKFPIKPHFCVWCWQRVKVKHDFNEFTTTCYCSVGCRDAEWLFRQLYSDNELTRRAEQQLRRREEDD